MAIAETLPTREGNRFFAQFRDPNSWIFAAVAVLVPNLPFVVLSIFACPNRILSIALYMVVAMLALSVPVWLSIILLMLAVAFDVVQVIAGIFDLSPTLIVESVRYAVAFDVFASPIYLGAVGLLLTTTVITSVLIARYRDRMKKAAILPAILCAFAMLAFDLSANALTLKKMGGLYESSVPFQSAIGQTGLNAAAVADSGHNMLFVMVEGMGAFADPAHRALLADMLKKAGLEDRYTLSEGLSRYVGSTTGAESRELCGHWGDHRDFMDKTHYDCLPARFANKGYDTAAFHAFTGNFFNRADWYPSIGFARSEFMEDLISKVKPHGARFCGLTFKGLCDLDVADRVEDYLTAPGDKPRFAYWLTLNSHMPVAPDEGTPRLDCANGGPFDDRMVCKMAEMWMDVLARVATLAADPKLARTDILIVGDHNPPLWTRHGRGLFRDGEVAWFALKAKDPAARQHASR